MLKKVQMAAREAGELHGYQGTDFRYLFAICCVLKEDTLDISPADFEVRFGSRAVYLLQKYE